MRGRTATSGDRRSSPTPPADDAGSAASLLDRFLPSYHAVERHGIDVRAPAEDVYAAVRRLDLSGSTVARLLLRLRGFPSAPRGIGGLLEVGFILLAESPPREIVLGLVSRFWRPDGEVLRGLDAAAFRAFHRPGYARAAWSFATSPAEMGTTRLGTETRVHCTDAASLRSFRPYWLLVRPFSGLLRRQMLRGIKRDAERGIAAA